MIKLKTLLLSIINEASNSQLTDLIGKTVENYTGLNWYDKQNKKNIVRNAKIVGFIGNSLFNAKLQDSELNRIYDIEIDPDSYVSYPDFEGHKKGAYFGTDQVENRWWVYAIDKNPDWTRCSINQTTDPVFEIHPYQQKNATKKGKETANLVVTLLDQIRKAIKVLPTEIKNMSAQSPDTMYVWDNDKAKKSDSMLLPYADDAIQSAVRDLKNEDGEFPGKSKLNVQIVNMDKDASGANVPELGSAPTHLSMNQIKQLVIKTQQLVQSLPEYVYFSDDTTELIDSLANEVTSTVNTSMN